MKKPKKDVDEKPQLDATAALLALAEEKRDARVPVVIDGSPHKYFVKHLNVDERSALEIELVAGCEGGVFRVEDDPGKFRAALVKYSAITEAGEKPYWELSLAEICRLPSALVEPFIQASMQLNRFDNAAADAMKKK